VTTVLLLMVQLRLPGAAVAAEASEIAAEMKAAQTTREAEPGQQLGEYEADYEMDYEADDDVEETKGSTVAGAPGADASEVAVAAEASETTGKQAEGTCEAEGDDGAVDDGLESKATLAAGAVQAPAEEQAVPRYEATHEGENQVDDALTTAEARAACNGATEAEVALAVH